MLVAINVVAYLLAIRHGGSFLGGPSESTEVRYGAIPYELTHPGRVLVDPSSSAPTLGASGAIAAVLGACIVLYPHARVITLILVIFFVTIVELPAALLLGFWFLTQLYLGAAGLTTTTAGGEGGAYFAHIGGFLFGLLLIWPFAARLRKPVPPRLPVY